MLQNRLRVPLKGNSSEPQTSAGRTLQRIAISATVLIVSAPVAHAADVKLLADAHVSSTRSTTNFGTLSNVSVGAGTTGLLQFDLTELPANTSAAQVAKATLRLYVNRVFTAGTVNVFTLAGSWTEAAVTFNTLPAQGTSAGSSQVVAAGQFVSIDVTSAVQQWMNSPSSNYGFALLSSDGNVLFDSKENDQTAHSAHLEVSLVSQGAVGPTGAAGPAGPVG
ncbi:MAG: DNRLRE domain-containing protein, partial [Janthinobacterium lividum]